MAEPDLGEPTPTPIPVVDEQAAAEPTPAPDEIPIVLGAVMAETGVMAQIDRAAIAGMQWQVGEINEAGGLLGRPLVIDVRDSQSRSSVSRDAARSLIDQGASVLLVSCDADFAKPVIEIADQRGVLTVAPCGTDLRWATAALGPLSFSFGTSPISEGRAMAAHSFETGARTAVAFADRTTPDALDFCQGFTDRFEELGGAVVQTYPFNYDQLTLLEELIAEEGLARTDVALLCTHLPGGLAGAPLVVEFLRGETVGLTAPFVGGSRIDGPAWLRAVIGLGDLTIASPTSVFGDDPVAAVNRMVADIDDPSRQTTRGWTAHGADAIVAITRAIETIGAIDGVAIARQFEQFDDEQLVSRAVTFSSTRHMDPGGPMRVLAVRGDTAELVETRTAN